MPVSGRLRAGLLRCTRSDPAQEAGYHNSPLAFRKGYEHISVFPADALIPVVTHGPTGRLPVFVFGLAIPKI